VKAYTLVQKNTKLLLVASKVTGLDINAEKTKYRLMSCEHNAQKNQNTNIGNKSFGRIAKCKYLERIIKNQNCMLKKLSADQI
jgi:hypothetical protein